MNKEIDSILGSPYKLIDIIGKGDEHFSLVFDRFKEEPKNGEVTGDLEVTYKCSGMESKLECDITIGNLYYFFYELDTAYDINFCKNSVAVLANYDDNRAKLTFRFDEHSHCFVNGIFKNKRNSYRSGISFDDFELDLLYVSEILFSLDKFLSEIIRIQGHSNFY